MTIRYKLTDENGYTRRGQPGETLWRPGTVRETDGDGELCGSGWTHVYTHPFLAEFFDHIHGDYGSTGKLISVTVSGRSKNDRGLKEGWTVVKYRRAEKRRRVNLTQKIAFGVLCALEVYSSKEFSCWAKKWLSGKDRSCETAIAAAEAAARAAGWAAARAAAWAAEAAAGAAETTAWAAAEAAAWAADRAAINLTRLAQKAMKVR